MIFSFVIAEMNAAIYESAIRASEEWRQFEEMCASMGDEGKELMAKRLERMRIAEQRRHEIEVAEAGRPRNFWGK